MHKRRVEPPGKSFGQRRRRNFGRPIIIGRIPVAGQAVVRERLHQTIELGAEPAFAEVWAGIN